MLNDILIDGIRRQGSLCRFFGSNREGHERDGWMEGEGVFIISGLLFLYG